MSSSDVTQDLGPDQTDRAEVGSTQRKRPHDIIEADGAVGVLLSNDPRRVWVDRTDYQRIIAAHGYRAWGWIKARQYVCLKPDRYTSIAVARTVVGDGFKGRYYT